MHIVIAGDSWGYVWTLTDDNGGKSPGLELFLKGEGHKVTNVAKPGAGNLEAFELLAGVESPDLIVFIQTEPIRDFWQTTSLSPPPLDAEHVLAMAKQHGGLVKSMRRHLRESLYSKLSKLNELKGIPILLVGGCSVINPKDVPTNLIVAVPSWCELLLGTKEFKDHIFQDTSHWLSKDYADLVIKSRDIDLIEDWYTVSKEVLDKTRTWGSDSEYFNPDKYHPNVKGHVKLFNALLPHIQRYM